jgi:hypothetical protein
VEAPLHSFPAGREAGAERLGDLGWRRDERRPLVEDAERAEPLLVPAVALGRRVGIEVGAEPLEPGEVLGDALGGHRKPARRSAFRGQGEAGLQLADRGHVGLAPHRPAPDDHADPGREVDRPGPGGNRPFPARRHQQEAALLGARGAMADIGEVVRPGVDELQDVIAAGPVGHVEPQRAAAEVDDRDRVDGVVVDRDELLVGPGELGGVGELVGPRRRHGAEAGLRHPLDLVEVEDEGEAVDVGLGGEGAQRIVHARDPSHGLRRMTTVGRSGDGLGAQTERPPSTETVVPVTAAPAGPQSQAIVAATSAGSRRRSIGCWAAKSAGPSRP